MATAKVGDIQMYYETHGSGSPLVLILGLASDISEYGWLIEALAKTHRVLCFDNRGAGRTDRPDEPYSIEQMADDTAGLMAKLKFSGATVVGISMGGRITLALAMDHPELVSKVVLVSSAARSVTQAWRPALDLVATTPGLGGKYPQPRYAYTRQRMASRSWDGTKRLGQIKVPTILLHGSKDKIMPLAIANETAAKIKSAKLDTFEGGHFFFMQSKPAFLAALADNLK